MKKHLLKIIVGGFIVFLALPVIFDTDDAESAATSKASAAVQQQEADVMLPVVQKALPFRSENVLSKYAGRFKRFYVNSKEEKQKISQEIQLEQNGSVYASADMGGGVRSSYGIAASPEDEAYVKEYFTDAEAKDAPANYGAVPASSGAKQKIHDNAPVKGLYESSAVDSYEARIKAKEVYSQAMSRVDTGSATEAETMAVSRLATGKRAVYVSTSEEADSANNSVKTESKYIGIAPKSGGRPSPASKGSLSGGFSSGGISAREADSSSGGINIGGFEVAAQNMEGKVAKVAPEGGVSKNFTVVSNGQGGAQKPSDPANPNQPQKPGTQPNNPNNPNNPGGKPNDPNNPGGNDPQPKPKPNTFDPSEWVSDYHLTCSADSFLHDNTTGPSVLEKMNIVPAMPTNLGDNAEKVEVNADKVEETTDIQTDKKEEPIVTVKNNQPDWDVPCDGLPQMPPSIVDKYKFLIIAGVKDGKYVVAPNTSFEGTLIRESGGKYTELPFEKAKDGYYHIPENVLTHKILKKDIIPVVREGEDLKGVYVKPGSLKQDREAYDKMISDIEKYSKEQEAEAAKKAAKDAADLEQKKKDLASGTAQDIQKANGK